MISDTVALVLATIIGPVSAVVITLWYQRRSERYERRIAIFRSLMQWRRNWLHAEWVGALNLVPVEFAGKTEILRSFNLLIDKLSDRGFAEQGEQLNAAYEKAETEFVEMLQKIGRAIRIDLSGFDLRGRVYAPSGWWREQQAIEALRSATAALLSGERPLSVRVIDDSSADA